MVFADFEFPTTRLPGSSGNWKPKESMDINKTSSEIQQNILYFTGSMLKVAPSEMKAYNKLEKDMLYLYDTSKHEFLSKLHHFCMCLAMICTYTCTDMNTKKIHIQCRNMGNCLENTTRVIFYIIYRTVHKMMKNNPQSTFCASELYSLCSIQTVNATSLMETFIFGMLIFSPSWKYMSFEYCNELVGNVSRHAPIIEPPVAMKVPIFAMKNNIVFFSKNCPYCIEKQM